MAALYLAWAPSRFSAAFVERSYFINYWCWGLNVVWCATELQIRPGNHSRFTCVLSFRTKRLLQLCYFSSLLWWFLKRYNNNNNNGSKHWACILDSVQNWASIGKSFSCSHVLLWRELAWDIVAACQPLLLPLETGDHPAGLGNISLLLTSGVGPAQASFTLCGVLAKCPLRGTTLLSILKQRPHGPRGLNLFPFNNLKCRLFFEKKKK